MMPTTVFIFAAVLVLGHCSTIPEPEKTDAESSSQAVVVDPTTSAPEIPPKKPHTHDEHPPNDPDHSDHIHPENQLKSVKVGDKDGDHDHPGHDHSETGHDHAVDHAEDQEGEKPAEAPQEVSEEMQETELTTSSDLPSTEEAKPTEEDKKESHGRRLQRALWRRRLE